MPYIDWPLTLFTVITQMALGAYAVLWATDLIARQFALRGIYGAVTGVIGGLGLLSMIQLYLLPAMPLWNSVATPLEFVATSLLAGPLLVGVVFAACLRWHPASNAHLADLLRMHYRYMAISVLVGAMLAAAAMAVRWWMLGGKTVEAQVAAALLRDEYLIWAVLRLVLFGIGAIVLPVWMLSQARARAPMARVGLVTAVSFGLTLAGELLGRVLFFLQGVPLRVPGRFF